jgi:hypothetical protein
MKLKKKERKKITVELAASCVYIYILTYFAISILKKKIDLRKSIFK